VHCDERAGLKVRVKFTVEEAMKAYRGE